MLKTLLMSVTKQIKKNNFPFQLKPEIDKRCLGIHLDAASRKANWFGGVRISMKSQLQPKAPLSHSSCSFMLQSERRWSFACSLFFSASPTASRPATSEFAGTDLKTITGTERRAHKQSQAFSAEKKFAKETPREKKESRKDFYFRFRSLEREAEKWKKFHEFFVTFFSF